MKIPTKTLMVLLAMLATSGLMAQEPSPDTSPVHGGPGEGRIRVETQGGLVRWEHPGVYWLPKGTTLLEFVRLATPKELMGDGTVKPCIEIRGSKRGNHFTCLPSARAVRRASFH